MKIFYTHVRRSATCFGKNFNKYGKLLFAIWLLVNVLAAFTLGPFDEANVSKFREISLPGLSNEHVLFVSNLFHHYADFVLFHLIIPGILVLGALLFRSRYLARVATTLLIAGVIGSLGVQIIKISLGRPRPPLVQRGEAEAWQLRGPTFKAKYRSYPSGHSATAATACTILSLAFPRLGIPLMFTALLIGLSRITHNYHYPTDVVAGLSYGLAMGFMAGLPLAKIRSRARLVRFSVFLGGTRVPPSCRPRLKIPAPSSHHDLPK